MATSWYYRTLGEEFGPVTENALRELIRASQLAHDEEVRPADCDDWMTVAYFEANYLESASADDLDSMLIEEEVAAPEPEHFELPEIVTEVINKIDTSTTIPLVTTSAPVSQGPPKPPRWYCRIQGQHLGPFDLPKLTRMVDAGELSPTDRVRLEDDTKWLTADGIEGLFADDSPNKTVHAQSHLSSQRMYTPLTKPASPTTDEDEFELKVAPQPETEDSQVAEPPSRKPSKAKAKKGKGKISQDEIVDILSDQSESEQETRRPLVGSSSTSTLASPPASVSGGYASPPAPAAAYAPPMPQPAPRYTPPPPRFAPPPPPRSSSSGSSFSLDIGEMLQNPAVKGVLALVILVPALWFGWTNFGSSLMSGGSGQKNEKYYLDMTVSVYNALMNAEDQRDFKSIGGNMKAVLEEVGKATDQWNTERSKAIKKCAMELLPKAIAGTYRDREANLGPVKNTLDPYR